MVMKVVNFEDKQQRMRNWMESGTVVSRQIEDFLNEEKLD